MTDRSELALQLTDAIAVARTAVERAGDRAFRAYGLSHRAHAALCAVHQVGTASALPQDIGAAAGGLETSLDVRVVLQRSVITYIASSRRLVSCPPHVAAVRRVVEFSTSRLSTRNVEN